METKKNKFRKIKTSKFIHMLFIALIVVPLISCSKDDGGKDAFITAGTTELSFDELNTCDIGSDPMATIFVFIIPYTTSAGNEVDKIEIDMEWSNGDTDSNREGNYTLGGSMVFYDWCYRFGDSEWIEITSRLVGKQGTRSNPSVIRINKPEGAN